MSAKKESPRRSMSPSQRGYERVWLTPATQEALGRVARPGESPAQTISRLVAVYEVAQGVLDARLQEILKRDEQETRR